MKKDTQKLMEIYKNIVSKASGIVVKKNEDYGSNFVDGGLEGLWWQMWHKVQRLRNLVIDGNIPNFESIRDTLIDLGNYSFLAASLVDYAEEFGFSEQELMKGVFADQKKNEVKEIDQRNPSK